MADQNTIEVKIGANVEGARRGAKEASDAVDSILDKLKDFKHETVSTGREARFFAMELASIVPGASAAAGAVKELLAVALSGSAIGIAVESVKLLAGAFREVQAETKRVKEAASQLVTDTSTGIAEFSDQIELMLIRLRGATEAQILWHEKVKPLINDQLKAQTTLENAEVALASARTKAGVAAHATAVLFKKGKEEEIAFVEAATKKEHEAVEQAKGVLDGIVAKIASAKAGIAEFDAEDKSLGKVRLTAKEKIQLIREIADAQQRADQATIESASNLARIQTEQEVAEDKRLGKVRLTVEEKIQLIQEIADAERRANVATIESEINLGRIETQQRALTKAQHKEWLSEFHAKAATAKEVGDAIGTALVGMASGSMSATKVIVEMMKLVIRSVIEMAIKMVTAKAATTAALAAESQAGIPIAGPWLAIGALAMVEGAVLALLSLIPGAATGADIPRGVNPIMQLHGGESVITRRTTDRLQDFLDGQGGDGGGGDTFHFHFNGPADANGIRTFVRSREFRDALRYARGLGEIT